MRAEICLSDEEIVRYSRQIILPEVGGEGQLRLRASSVLIVGLGALGSPAAYYLAAAGVGRLGLADGDEVDLSNLQRQILHATADVGRPKVDSARRKLAALNPEIRIDVERVFVDTDNAAGVIAGYDVVVSAVDNVPARYALNDACVSGGVPLVDAAIVGFRAILMTILPGRGPCYRCLFPEPPPAGAVPTCAEAGVIGALAGVLGALQALETIKLLLGRGNPYVGRVLQFDGLTGRFREAPWPRDPGCPVCGDRR